MTLLTLRPNGAGASTQLSKVGDTANYLCVDETSRDSATTYVKIVGSEDAAVTGIDLYALPDHSSESGTINSVTAVMVAKYVMRISTGAPRIQVNGTNYGNAAGGLTTSYATYSQTWATNPNSGVAWTWSDIDALQAGCVLTGARRSGDARATQIYIEVDYTEGGGAAFKQSRALLGVGW